MSTPEAEIGRLDKPFTFMKLPPELRCNVYRYYLIHPLPILVSPPGADEERLDLLRVCQLINTEATTIYYGENIFYWSELNTSRLKLLLHTRYLPLLRNVTIEAGHPRCYTTYDDSDFVLAELLRNFTGSNIKLTSLTFQWTCGIMDPYGPIAMALKSLRAIRRLHISVSECGTIAITLRSELESNFMNDPGRIEGSTIEIMDLVSPHGASGEESLYSYSEDDNSSTEDNSDEDDAELDLEEALGDFESYHYDYTESGSSNWEENYDVDSEQKPKEWLKEWEELLETEEKHGESVTDEEDMEMLGKLEDCDHTKPGSRNQDGINHVDNEERQVETETCDYDYTEPGGINRRENHDVGYEEKLEELEEGMLPMAGNPRESITDDGKVEVLGRVKDYDFSAHTFRHVRAHSREEEEEDEEESIAGDGGELNEQNTDEADSDELDSFGEIWWKRF
ncbi:MAG: hypothetical protein M1836_008098 [Candelina mexicana]|nr:MAG: hypothetical protein M1836_008098 [Candelina mexicana]